MGKVIRQSILTSIVSYTGILVGYVNLLYLYPRFLQPEQMGLLRTIQDIAMLMAPFAQIGLANSIIRFYPKFSNDEGQANSFISFILLISLIGYGIFILIFFSIQGYIISFFEENAAVVTNYIALILWMTFFLVVITILEYYSRSLLKIVVPNFLREILIRLLQGILVSIYFLKLITFEQFLMLSVAIYLVSLTILITYLLAQGHLKVNFSFHLISWETGKELLIYSLLSYVGAASTIIIGKVDSIMVTGMIGLAANAIYTNSFYMATVIEIPKRAITQSAFTLISKAFTENNFVEIQSIYRKTAINQFIIGALLMIGVWANLENIFQLMPKGETFQTGTMVVVFVGIAKLVDMAFGPNGEIIVSSKYYWFNMVTVIIFAIIVVTTNLILIPRYGMMGAAYATTLALIIFNMIKWTFVYFILKMQPFGFAFVKVLAIITVTSLMNYFLPKAPNVLIDIFYRSALITGVYGSLILISSCSEEINKTFTNALLWIGLKRSK
ncbi:MAG TPA: oligosaccharide flippase family protein [Cyclobacteriaceae bacterium]|nr:oligosaccharide flippase family protein [Cyclobacteriaceae bacterium]